MLTRVKENLNALLDAEADALAGAGRYERSNNRLNYRAGHRNQKYYAKASGLIPRVVKLGN